ncbi:DNA-deoxyinosine glycosylase [Neptunomonas japonica]|uniref:TDG/mug DNA glycosylase family protein n=1 Tax=Neptunomonas japonica JAMM 1380 TaxID=1441457 RepID=A0A7R6SWS7_9GAMM|nr:DNA-deoxyinosine glycosylase [Neptunomonas japonica]BBB30736.1 TDG/mug DNA glycosylase family protein [Neptunomonas japonica JAMM 1380]
MPTPVISFHSIAPPDAQLLILGSIPGVKSLQEQQYYAHPRNSFWKIMSELWALPHELSYQSRLSKIQTHGIALWDVAQQCIRPGSLDSKIDQHSVIPNAIPALLTEHPQIHTICFNGQAAAKLFKQHFPDLLAVPHITYITLPSTSPAHASMIFADKLKAWHIVKESIESKGNII